MPAHNEKLIKPPKKRQGEDRVRLPPFLGSVRTLSWETDKISTSLNTLFDELAALSNEPVKYYETVSNQKSRISRILRICGLTVGTAGVICPLLVSTEWAWTQNRGLQSLGYILLALAAALVSADSIFSLSSGRARCVAVQLELESLIMRSILRWATSKSKIVGRSLSPDSTDQAFLILNEFTSSLFEVVRGEAETWQADLQERIAELQGLMKSRNQRGTSG